MPIDVDEVQRRRAIAKATLAVAARDGARAVTIREVAKELGGSTAMVTNYVPTRVALITNAVDAADPRWRAELESHVQELDGEARLRATVEWYLSTEPDDLVLRGLWVERLSSNGMGKGQDRAISEEADATWQELRSAAANAEVAEPDLAADILFFLVRGYFVATVEGADQASPERAARVAHAIVDMLKRDPGPEAGPESQA
jgi:AcrR family transcriptional regulator